MSTQDFLSWEEAVNWLISQPDKQDLVRACYYDRPVERAAERFWRSDEWRAVRSILSLPPGGHALDVGAGAGISSYALARDGWKVTALEPDSSETVGAGAIRRLSAHGNLGINVIQDFGERIAANDESFDAIHARQVLHHASDLPQFCRELFRVLKTGGVLLTTRDHVISGPSQLPAFFESHPLHCYYGGENAFRLADYKKALRNAGFVIERSIGPFDSVINFAPHSRGSLRHALITHAGKIPGGEALGRMIFAEAWLDLVLKMLSIIDHRPGRCFSFLCRKPEFKR